MTFHGADFRIREPIPFDRKWYSHNFHGLGLRYELGVCINTGKIVSFHGPFPCGLYNDVTIFRLWLKWKLGEGKKVLDDLGYKGYTKVMTPYDAMDYKNLKAMNVSRAHHEKLNGRLKSWDILSGLYLHNRDKHYLIFRSIIVLENIKIPSGHPPFHVTSYNNNSKTKLITFYIWLLKLIFK